MRDFDPVLGRRTATDRRQHFRMTVEFFTESGKFSHLADPVERMATLALLGASIGMCLRQGTDGHILPEVVLEETGMPPEYAKTLITDGAWHQADHGCVRCPQPRLGHIYVHDILEHNRSAGQERQLAEQRRRHGAAGGQSRWAGHTKPEPRPKGRPGRPPRAQPAMLVPGDDAPTVLQHPAEQRAREETKRRGRPRRTEPVIFDQIVLDLCDELAQVVRDNGFSVGVIGPAWWTPCEQLLRIGPPNAKEAVTPEQIRKAMTWANADAFWWEQIRSMKQLREKYEQLRSASKNPNRTRRGAAPRRFAGPGQPPAAVSVPNMSQLYADDYAPGGR